MYEPVKWKCRFPVGPGKLCERMDRVKCPFHGKVIARDEKGTPANPEEAEVEAKRLQEQREADKKSILADMDAQIGTKLRQQKRKAKLKPATISKKRYARLTDVSGGTGDRVKKRLEKKVLNKRSLQRVNDTLDSILKRKQMEKFGSNFNYQ